MALDLQHREIKPLALITLKGKLLLGPDTIRLAAIIVELINTGHTQLVFDLSGLTHIDSTGIGRFIDTHSRLSKVGGRMRLAGASGAIRDSFHVTRLDTVFAFFPTVEEACQGLS